MDLIEILRIILGSIFVLFIPGFAWSFVFFNRDEIDAIERIALSFGLSIAMVPLMIFYLNYIIGVKITFINSTISILILTLAAIVLWLAKEQGLFPARLADLKKLWKS